MSGKDGLKDGLDGEFNSRFTATMNFGDDDEYQQDPYHGGHELSNVSPYQGAHVLLNADPYQSGLNVSPSQRGRISSNVNPSQGAQRPSNVSVDPDSDSDCYKMNHRQIGKFILINNHTFDSGTGLSERTGTDVDASKLCNLFRKKLGFDVKRYNNLKAVEMKRIMQDAGRENYEDCDCIAVAVLTHGEDGILFGTDAPITIENFIEPIKKCLSLAGKPKLFFFQACRGTELDSGVEVQSDAAAVDPRNNIARIPQEADFLFAYSTVPGYYSWRSSTKGSFFIQALVRVLKDPAYEHLDLLRMLTRVCRIMCYEFESNANEAHLNRKKQTCSIVSQLTKDLYFPPPK